VSGFQLGDRIADLTVVGSNAAYRTLRADRLTRVPAGLDAAEAATLILSWMTAYQLLHRAARVQRDLRVLVHGAAGAVGQALLALGRLAGLELWGTAHGKHAALIRELGATPIPQASRTRRVTMDIARSRGPGSRLIGPVGFGGRVRSPCYQNCRFPAPFVARHLLGVVNSESF
jgi:NADPH:quinone reductase-like Zn-dependent oxidoreductase